jgi:uncharacterized membrane protein
VKTLGIVSTIGFGLLVLTSMVIGVYAFFFQAEWAGSPEFQARFNTAPILAGMHVIGAGVALLIGPFQFIRRLRTSKPSVHRNVGRLYLLMILVGGVGGLGLAQIAAGGLVSRVGFSLLDICWLFTALMAYRAIRNRRFVDHQQWMMRNFALTFGAVTLRLWLPLLGAAGHSFEASYQVVAWLAWVPNLLVVEWYLVIQAERARACNATTAL